MDREEVTSNHMEHNEIVRQLAAKGKSAPSRSLYLSLSLRDLCTCEPITNVDAPQGCISPKRRKENKREKESTQPRMGMVHVRSVAIDATREKNRSADHIRYAASLLLCRVGLVSGIEQRPGCVQPAGTRCEEKVAWLPCIGLNAHTHALTLSLPDRDWRREICRECLF